MENTEIGGQKIRYKTKTPKEKPTNRTEAKGHRKSGIGQQ